VRLRLPFGISRSAIRHPPSAIRMSVSIAPEPPHAPDVLALLAQSDAYMAGLYPPESNHMLDAQALARPHVRFFVARRPATGDGPHAPALGCGALVLDGGGSAEIKRLFVAEAARGQGLGRRLLQRLEACAIQEGVHTLLLETGIYQPAALALYAAAGYAVRGPFGAYGPDPYSVFMQKRLSRGAGAKAG